MFETRQNTAKKTTRIEVPTKLRIIVFFSWEGTDKAKRLRDL
jgi:hypothetical protein